jgi:hypothetical protein
MMRMWKRLRARKARATEKRPIRRLCLEHLEDRCVPSVTGYSSIDEVGNNAADPTLGTANTDLLRISPADYKPVANGGDGLNTPSLTYGAPTFVAGPRLVSNTVDNQATTLFGSVDTNTVDGNGLSDFGYTFGQFMDHDMDLTPTQSDPAPTPDPNKDGVDGFPIPVDPVHTGDPIGSLAFTRSIFDPTTGITTPREQINAVTSYLDLSQVYGSTADLADALRLHTGGLLKTSPGNMLPYDNLTYFTQDQLNIIHMANDAGLVPTSDLFVAGDVRANETTELTSLQTLFMRNHNRIAGILAADHTDWTDDQLYQEARKLNIAQYQSIIYNAYLPALLGPTAMSAYAGYDPTVDPSIATEFSTVGFRFGHSMLNNTVARDANDGSSVGDLDLAYTFFNPHLLNPNNVTDPMTGLTSTDIGAVLKGDADNNAQAMDIYAVRDVRNLLFGQGGPGEDLIARDIWRADDHGIGTYNQVRVAYGLAPITDTGVSDPSLHPGDPGFHFHGFELISSDPVVVQRLIDAYTGPTRDTFLANGKFAGDINPFIAGLAEDHVPGSDLGPLFNAIVIDQFTRLRSGDQFFYQNESFSAEELSIFQGGNTLGEVIQNNTDITQVQNDVFRFLSQQDGKTRGYYTTTNGRTELTGSATGTQLSSTIYNGLVAALTKPGDSSHLVLVDASGNYLSASFLQSYSNLKSFLNSVSLNAANLLSVQLLTTELNILLSKIDGTASVFVPAVTVPGTNLNLGTGIQAVLQNQGVTNPSGIASMQDILNASIAELLAAPKPTFGSGDILYEGALTALFVGINYNEAIFIG